MTEALLLTVLLAFTAACGVTYLLMRPSAAFQILDRPNDRSLHTKPVPRTGGLGIWAGLLVGAAYVTFTYASLELAAIVGVAMVIGVVSLLDDRLDLAASLRLAVHLIAAVLLLVAGFGLRRIALPGHETTLPVVLLSALSVLFVVWMTNLYNFMDGIDGLAGGMAVVGFGTFAVLGGIAGNPLFALFSATIAAGAAGFLVFNFPPARIFMGDSGSSVLGFLAAACALWADRDELFPLWISVFVFSPFVVDASITLSRRLLRREPIWTPHKTHYYQRMVRMGWTHRRTTLSSYVLMVLSGMSAVASLGRSDSLQWGLIGIWAIGYLLLFTAIEKREQHAARTRLRHT